MICSNHFKPEDFEPQAEYRQRRQLKRTAVPSNFNFPPHLQPKKVKLRQPPKERVLPHQMDQESPVSTLNPELETFTAPVQLDHDYSVIDARLIKNQLDLALIENENLKKLLACERKKVHFQKKDH